MFETITKFAEYLEKITFLTYPVTILLGFLSGMTAITCLIPLVPAVAGFVGIQEVNRRKLIVVPFFIMLGSIVTLVALGIVVSMAGLTLQKSLSRYWPYFIGLICMMVGLFVLRVIKVPTRIKIPKIERKGVIVPFAFGLVLGGVMRFGSSCCLPVLPVVLTYAAIQGRPAHGALILGTFAIGQSIPLFAIGLFTTVVSKFTSKWSVYVRYIAGVLLLVAGIYFILREVLR